MKALDNYVCTGQMTIFDFLGPDTWCGKTSQEPSVQTKEKTSEQSLKKFAELRIKPPMYLDLRMENGVRQVASWEIVGPLLGEYTMLSFGECPSVENVSRLSQILEDRPHQKYSLSAKACQGILNRANRRGKKLPKILEEALIRQATHSKYEGGVEIDSKGKKAGKGALIQTELSGTLGVSQDQTLITTGECLTPWDTQTRRVYGTDGVYPTLCRMSENSGQDQKAVFCIEGNGQRDSHKGDGYKESETMYTLNTVEQHGVVYSMGHDIRSAKFTADEITDPLTATDYKDPIKINDNRKTYQDITGTLDCGITKGTGNQLANSDMFIANTSVVRRLTPMECERLQGYPDHWTDIGEWTDSKGKLHKDADSPRYKALGNSIALPFWEWMAKRMVSHLDTDHPTMASLFDGIGGFPLVYSRNGCEPIWASEIEEFPIAVTKIRFPEQEEP